MLQYCCMPKTAFLTFINNSSLSEDDKALWENLDLLEDHQINIMVSFVNGEEEKLIFITENLKTKQQLLENYDEKVANKMMRAVADQLSSLAE